MTTRIDKFTHSFQAFMDSFDPTIEKWDFVKDHPSNTGNYHTFTLTMPMEYSEQRTRSEDGYIVNETLTISQQRPTDEEFRTKFDEYFDPFRNNFRNQGVSIDMLQIDEQQTMTMQICLSMCSGYPLPFPIPTYSGDSRYQALQMRNHALMQRYEHQNETIEALENEVRHLRHSRRALKNKHNEEKMKMRERLSKNDNRLIQKIKSYYNEQSEKENCPVCYEPIKAEDLYVPGCCHYLCKYCANRVKETSNRCPICRDDLYTHEAEAIYQVVANNNNRNQNIGTNNRFRVGNPPIYPTDASNNIENNNIENNNMENQNIGTNNMFQIGNPPIYPIDASNNNIIENENIVMQEILMNLIEEDLQNISEEPTNQASVLSEPANPNVFEEVEREF